MVVYFCPLKLSGSPVSYFSWKGAEWSYIKIKGELTSYAYEYPRKQDFPCDLFQSPRPEGNIVTIISNAHTYPLC